MEFVQKVALVKIMNPDFEVWPFSGEGCLVTVVRRCNLRCQYCMPLEGVPLTPSPDLLSSDEIVKIAGIFVSEGVKKVAPSCQCPCRHVSPCLPRSG